MARNLTLSLAALVAVSSSAVALQVGEEPGLGTDRITQAEIQGGIRSFFEIRKAGMRVFSAPLNRLDGFGDGPFDPLNPTEPGARPTIGGNGAFLRINGLDAQTCMECHGIGSFATVPFTFALGGAGASNNNAFPGATLFDLTDNQGNGFAAFNGRNINPPFLFGAGGVELAAKEMTNDLQRWKNIAQSRPDTVFSLNTKGVNFGTISYSSQLQQFDLSNVEGVEHDLVVRPFGRKGEFSTLRKFDEGAMRFHMGIEPVETVGAGVDGDNDGVVDELLIGEMSALHIFGTNLERPLKIDPLDFTETGGAIFETIGCADCHRPFLDTYREALTYSFPEDEVLPFTNVFFKANLKHGPSGFESSPVGGVRVPLFSDLKRHNMGPGLAESTGSPLDPFFITPRLWGIADTAPYLHDGRALTLTEAIEMHDGEGAAASAAFSALNDTQKVQLLNFLRTLRTPTDPGSDLF